MHTQHTIDAKKAKGVAMRKSKGFTLLELLIVIAILAILATVVVLVLNPAETLKKTRDSQRLTDMSVSRAALALYITQINEPKLDNTDRSDTNCLSNSAGTTPNFGTAASTAIAGTARNIWVSLPASSDITDDKAIFNIAAAEASPYGSSTATFQQVALANLFNTDGTGWMPVNLASIKGGSTIANLPVDPTNSVVSLASVANSDLIYRYACRSSKASDKSTTFELNARMESDDFKPGGGSDKAAKDGGNNSNLYEVGTDLTILPSLDGF